MDGIFKIERKRQTKIQRVSSRNVALGNVDFEVVKHVNEFSIKNLTPFLVSRNEYIEYNVVDCREILVACFSA